MAIGGIILEPTEGEVTPDPKNQKVTGSVIMISLMTALGGFLFGYDTGIVSGAMVFIREDLHLDDIWQEVIISATILGAWMFSIPAGSFANVYGRKKTVYLSATIFTVGSFIMAFAPEKITLLIGRFSVGIAIGLASMVVPMMIAEMAPSNHRGSLVTTNNLFITGGQAIAGFVAGLLSPLPQAIGWRVMLGIAAVPSSIQLIAFMLWVPESPRWLIQQSRMEEAKEVLIKLRGPDADVDIELDSIIRSIHSSSSDEDHPKSSRLILLSVMKDHKLRRLLMVGCLLQAVQQLTGINTVMYYAATIIQMSGQTDKSTAVWMASLTALVNFLTTFVGVYLVERIGRRTLTLCSLAGVILSLIMLSFGFYLQSVTSPVVTNLMLSPVTMSTGDSTCINYNTCSGCVSHSGHCGFCFSTTNQSINSCFPIDPNNGYSINGTSCDQQSMSNATSDVTSFWADTWCPSRYSWTTLLALCTYVLLFGPGMGPMPWTINSELYPTWCRSPCISVTTATCWFCNLVVSLTFLSLNKWVTIQGSFLLYASFGLFGFIIFWWLLPETKGQSMEGHSPRLQRTQPIASISFAKD